MTTALASTPARREPAPAIRSTPPLTVLLRRASQAADMLLQEGLHQVHAKMTPRQLMLLEALAGGPLIQDTLVRVTGIDRSTLADMLRRLQRRGWIARRTHNADARAKVVTLTGEGQRVLARAREIATAANHRIADEAGLDAVDLNELEVALDRIIGLGGR